MKSGYKILNNKTWKCGEYAIESVRTQDAELNKRSEVHYGQQLYHLQLSVGVNMGLCPLMNTKHYKYRVSKLIVEINDACRFTLVRIIL